MRGLNRVLLIGNVAEEPRRVDGSIRLTVKTDSPLPGRLSNQHYEVVLEAQSWAGLRVGSRVYVEGFLSTSVVESGGGHSQIHREVKASRIDYV